MNGALAACPHCQSPLAAVNCNTPKPIRCPFCQSLIQVEIFPALFKPIARGRAAEPDVIEGESSCFYHERKKAVTPCDICGRFLCALCDVEINNQHICPACLETGRKRN